MAKIALSEIVQEIRATEKTQLIRFRRNETQREQLRLFCGTDFLHDLREGDLGHALFIGSEQLPLCEIDPVKKVETMPALFGNEGSVLVGHRLNFRSEEGRSRCMRVFARRERYPELLLLAVPAAWGFGKCGRQYSSPLRAT